MNAPSRVCERNLASTRAPSNAPADVAVESPEALCLGGSQSESGHLQKFTLYSLEHLVDTHLPSPESLVCLQCYP